MKKWVLLILIIITFPLLLFLAGISKIVNEDILLFDLIEKCKMLFKREMRTR